MGDADTPEVQLQRKYETEAAEIEKFDPSKLNSRLNPGQEYTLQNKSFFKLSRGKEAEQTFRISEINGKTYLVCRELLGENRGFLSAALDLTYLKNQEGASFVLGRIPQGTKVDSLRFSTGQMGEKRVNVPNAVISSFKPEIPLDDSFISEQHCRVIWRRGKWYLEDLESTNGTFIESTSPLTKRVRDFLRRSFTGRPDGVVLPESGVVGVQGTRLLRGNELLPQIVARSDVLGRQTEAIVNLPMDFSNSPEATGKTIYLWEGGAEGVAEAIRNSPSAKYCQFGPARIPIENLQAVLSGEAKVAGGKWVVSEEDSALPSQEKIWYYYMPVVDETGNILILKFNLKGIGRLKEVLLKPDTNELTSRKEGSFVDTANCGAAISSGKKRAYNQDLGLVVDRENRAAPIDLSLETEIQEYMETIQKSGLGLYLVADGMGGHQEGDQASLIASLAVVRNLGSFIKTGGVETYLASLNTQQQKAFIGRLKSRLRQEGREETEVQALLRDRNNAPFLHRQQVLVEQLEGAVKEANEAVCQFCQSEGIDGGTTLTVALVAENAALIANVGDSRVYLSRGKALAQITKDHSLVQRLIDVGRITPEQAKNHPQANVIYRSIGQRGVKADVFVQPLLAGDRLLLCSDGLTKMVEDGRIKKIMEAKTCGSAAKKLVDEANQKGGEDNIIAIVAGF
ncbi:MAG TPA: protein phosphatase 2C domain-containing protein [Candidatus Bathyarchaeia archaeon]|nr:protein phosphatase 2C domain-containing protein [Candidatus Bathyarchaeia archaeon]